MGTFALVPDNHELLRNVIAAPGVIALLSALFQLMRDEVDYEKRLEAQRREFQFTLGAASHMANAAFDKHSEFCEKYMKELHSAVNTLYIEGETSKSFGHAGNLYTVREDYATWLTDKINSDLEEFESVLRKLGANARFINSTAGHPDHAERRALRIDANFELFARILGLAHNDIQQESMVDALKTKVRAILGIEDLTKLRDHLIKQASSAIDRSAQEYRS